MRHSSNVLWKLNTKGLEILNKAGVVASNSQVQPNIEENSTIKASLFRAEALEKTTVPDTDKHKDLSSTQVLSDTTNSAKDLRTKSETVTTALPNSNNDAFEKEVVASSSTQTSPSQMSYEALQATRSRSNTNPSQHATATIEGKKIESIGLEPISNWHLRKKKADLFIEDLASITYLDGLKKFLTSKGINWQHFDPTLHYLPYDLMLITRASFKKEGECAFLDAGKANVWKFLKDHFNFSA